MLIYWIKLLVSGVEIKCLCKFEYSFYIWKLMKTQNCIQIQYTGKSYFLSGKEFQCDPHSLEKLALCGHLHTSSKEEIQVSKHTWKFHVVYLFFIFV